MNGRLGGAKVPGTRREHEDVVFDQHTVVASHYLGLMVNLGGLGTHVLYTGEHFGQGQQHSVGPFITLNRRSQRTVLGHEEITGLNESDLYELVLFERLDQIRASEASACNYGVRRALFVNSFFLMLFIASMDARLGRETDIEQECRLRDLHKSNNSPITTTEVAILSGSEKRATSR